MDMEFSAEDLAFQKEVHDWIQEKYPAEMRQRYKLSGHLTKEDLATTDKDLIAYYQFNEALNGGTVMDKVEGHHSGLSGGAAIAMSSLLVFAGIIVSISTAISGEN